MPKNNPLEFPPIIYQDESILVIDKPAGMIVQKSHTHNQPTLEQALPGRDDLERKGIVHRLDRDTSGLMVIAQTPAAQQSLYQQFQKRQVQKEYQALVWGEFKDHHAIIEAPIARHPHYGYKYVVMEGGREAKTEAWKTQVFSYHDDKMTLLKLRLHTGRTHQIRVHLHALGYPMVGDKIYGRRKDSFDTRQFLHANHLSFTHPDTRQLVEFDTPLPGELQAFIDQLQPVVGQSQLT